MRLRVLASSSGRAQTDPHATSVMNRWNGASNGVWLASARSRSPSPSTARRTRVPASYRAASPVGSLGMLVSHVVLGQARRCRLRADDVPKLRQLQLVLEGGAGRGVL